MLGAFTNEIFSPAGLRSSCLDSERAARRPTAERGGTQLHPRSRVVPRTRRPSRSLCRSKCWLSTSGTPSFSPKAACEPDAIGHDELRGAAWW